VGTQNYKPKNMNNISIEFEESKIDLEDEQLDECEINFNSCMKQLLIYKEFFNNQFLGYSPSDDQDQNMNPVMFTILWGLGD
jgi:hypothetical protein